jgi:hypothetical protein
VRTFVYLTRHSAPVICEADYATPLYVCSSVRPSVRPSVCPFVRPFDTTVLRFNSPAESAFAFSMAEPVLPACVCLTRHSAPVICEADSATPLYVRSSVHPSVRLSVRLTRQFCVLIHRQNRPLHFLRQNRFCRWIKMKGEKRSPKRRSLFFNAADMQLASQLRLVTRLSSPSGNSPTLRILRITQRMTWPTHALAVLSVLQGRGKGRGRAGQGRAGAK